MEGKRNWAAVGRWSEVKGTLLVVFVRPRHKSIFDIDGNVQITRQEYDDAGGGRRIVRPKTLSRIKKLNIMHKRRGSDLALSTESISTIIGEKVKKNSTYEGHI